jgi:hypothetical protein
MSVNQSNEKLFRQLAEWKCEHTGCALPAARVIEWRHQDGDGERRILCKEHGVEDQEYWSAMDWDAGVAVSDIEEWQLSVSYCGKALTRAGNRFNQSAGL